MSRNLLFSCAMTITMFSSAIVAGATVRASPGDDLQRLVNAMQNDDTLLLADGTYEKTCIDLTGKIGITIAAAKITPVTVDAKQNAHGGNVILRGQSKPFIVRGGAKTTLRGLTVSGCSNALQEGAIQLGSGAVVEDVLVERVDTAAVSIVGTKEHPVRDITLTRVIAQDNGYIGIGGSFAMHVRLTDCASFRNNRGWPTNVFGDQGFQKDGKWYVHVQWEGGGGKFASCEDVVILRHDAEGNNGPGLWFDYDNKNIVVRDSKFLNQTWVENDYDALGMQLEINDGPTLIENCLFQGNVGGLCVAEDHKATIRNCHFVDSLWTRNMSEDGKLRNDGVQDLAITGNTFYGDAKIALTDGMDDAYCHQNRVVIKDNILHANLPPTWKVEAHHPSPTERGRG